MHTSFGTFPAKLKRQSTLLVSLMSLQGSGSAVTPVVARPLAPLQCAEASPAYTGSLAHASRMNVASWWLHDKPAKRHYLKCSADVPAGCGSLHAAEGLPPLPDHISEWRTPHLAKPPPEQEEDEDLDEETAEAKLQEARLAVGEGLLGNLALVRTKRELTPSTSHDLDQPSSKKQKVKR